MVKALPVIKNGAVKIALQAAVIAAVESDATLTAHARLLAPSLYLYWRFIFSVCLGPRKAQPRQYALVVCITCYMV